METAKKIIEASKEVFTKNGYLGSSTKLIAKTACVSEMTLFRKFTSKENLFQTMIQTTLGAELFDLIEVNYETSLFEFTKNILHKRLLTISKNIDLVRMIIEESILGRINPESNYIAVIKGKITETLKIYGEKHGEKERPGLELVISGILLQYVILTPSIEYYKLEEAKQEEYLKNLMSVIKF